jgi:hypothetical protein
METHGKIHGFQMIHGDCAETLEISRDLVGSLQALPNKSKMIQGRDIRAPHLNQWNLLGQFLEARLQASHLSG